MLPLLLLVAHGALNAQVLSSLGTTAPAASADDISQLSTSGNVAWPDGLNYFTDNSAPAAQTFTMGAATMRLKSLAIKTAGLNSGGGYGSPANTPTFYLRIYSTSGGTATLLLELSAPNPGFTDGDWLLWSGLNVNLVAHRTYAFSFGSKPGAGGWAALAVATGAYSGGEIANIPISGGTITTGSSHGFDAVFNLGLQAAPADIPANTPWPMPTYGFNTGNKLELSWGAPNPKVFYTAVQNGFNAVRIPCAWNHNANKDLPTYPIDPAYMAQVKQTVDAAIDAGLYVVINDHWDDGWLENDISETIDPVIEAKMKAYWTQIATTFAGYDKHLLFAAANEPNVDNVQMMKVLMYYYQLFLNVVRASGGNNADRWLVMPSISDPTWMNALPTDTVPNRLMVEYHNYTPSLFTIIHEDQSWGNAIYYWGKAYHYAGDPSRNATWGEEYDIDAQHQQLSDLYVSKGIPVMIGEYHAAPTSSLTGEARDYNRASMYYWNKYAGESARVHGLSPFYWSTGNAPFDYDTGANNDPTLCSVLTGGAAPPPPNGAPYAPSGLTATGGAGQVALSWTAGDGATSYNLYRATVSGGGSKIAPVVTGITGTSYTNTGLASGTTYYYQVVAVNASGLSGFSTEAKATTSGVAIVDPAQYNFESTTQSWSGSGGTISGVATSSTRFFAGNKSLAVNFTGTAGGTSAVSVGNVAAGPGTTITFRVWIPAGSKVTTLQPYLMDNNWNWSSGWFQNLTTGAWNTITLTVPASATSPLQALGIQFITNAAWTGTCYVDSVSWPASVPDFTLETNPASLTVNGATSGTSTITVTELNGLNAAYTLSVAGLPAGVSASFAQNPTIGGTNQLTLAASDTVTPGTTNVTVTATAGSLSHTTSIALTLLAPNPPEVPTNLVATPVDSLIGLAWSAASGAMSYNVKRATMSGGPYTTVANVTTTSYDDTGLVNGTTYYYVVSSVNVAGESANSSQAGAAPVETLPTNLVATPGDSLVALAWSAANGATSYNVKRATVNGGPYTTVANVTTTSYTDTDLVNETTYYYVVSAVNASGESANSGQAGATPIENAARYAFEGDALDGSGNGYHGTATSLTYVPGKVGAQAAQFNGTSSYVEIPRSVLGDFTVALWVKTTDTAGSAGAHWWSGKGLVDGEVGGGGADWGTSIVNGKLAFGVGSGSGDTTIASSININDGAWHHLAATRDNTTGAMRVYVDGILRGSGTGATGARTLPPALRIGGLQPGYNFLNGTLDDVRLYNRILGDAELATLAAGPQPPAAPQNLAASPGDATITLSWSASAGATAYTVRRSASVAGPFVQIATGVTGTSHADTGLADGATWYYTVSANGPAGQGPESAPVSATTFTEQENWRAEHFGTTANAGDAADAADPDGDGWTNLDEYIAGTVPTDPASQFKITQLQMSGGEFVVSFPSALGRIYTVERSYTLEPGSWVALPGETPGTGETLSVTETDPTESPRRFYRVVVTR